LDGLRSNKGPLAQLLSIAVHHEAGDWTWLSDFGPDQNIGDLYRQTII